MPVRYNFLQYVTVQIFIISTVEYVFTDDGNRNCMVILAHPRFCRFASRYDWCLDTPHRSPKKSDCDGFCYAPTFEALDQPENSVEET